MKNTAPIMTVGYIIRHTKNGIEVLLAEKAPTEKAHELGIAGKRMGYGGFMKKEDANAQSCFIRELREETGLKVNSLQITEMARVLIQKEGSIKVLRVFVVEGCSDTPKSSRETLDPQWYHEKQLPENMLGSDPLILPLILGGQKITGLIEYDNSMNIIQANLNPVRSLF